jgi:hypothetical protein
MTRYLGAGIVGLLIGRVVMPLWTFERVPKITAIYND